MRYLLVAQILPNNPRRPAPPLAVAGAENRVGFIHEGQDGSGAGQYHECHQ